MAVYCTDQDMEDRASASGVQLRIDDYTSGADRKALLLRIRERASVQVDLFLLQRYDATTLAASTWVKNATADLSICLLTRRRGNPPPTSFSDVCDEVTEQLKAIKEGAMALPDAPARKGAAPVMSNVRIRLDPYPRPVVQRSESTGTPAGYTQNVDTIDPIFPR